jgi:ASC-1-like (ASCH) protein
MTTHECGLQQRYLSLIKSGQKTVEGRLFKGKFTTFKLGDKIKFVNQNDSVVKTIGGIGRYKTFKEMLQIEGLGKCLPGETNIDRGVEIYHSIPDYKIGEISYGVVAFRLR